MTRTATGERRRGAARAFSLAAVALLLAAGVRPAGAQQQISVSASVESAEVAVGQPFVLSIRVEGAQNVPVPVVEVDDFRADYLGPATQVSVVNGRMSTTVTHRYRLIAREEGEFRLGPFIVLGDDDKRYETAPVSVRVRPAGTRPRAQAVAPGGDQAFRLTIEPARPEVYVGERVEVTVTLYVGDVRVRDLQYPVIRADGVTVEKFGQAEQGSEVIDRRRYTTVRLRTHLTPVRAGTIPLRPTMQLNVLSRRHGIDPFFDTFLSGDARPVEVEGEITELTVLPLPEEGRPASFTGAVGAYDFALTAQPTSLQAGDPITLRMEITGTGNLAALDPPAVPTGDGFRRYDAQPVKGEDGDARRVFEQVLIPRDAGVAEIPAVAFSYFDPAARAYRTIRRGPIPIAVRAAPAGVAGVLDAAPATPAETPVAPVGRDIVYIKDVPGTLRPARASGWATAPFVVLLGVPVLAFAAVQAFVRRRDRLAGDPRRVRFRAAGREAQRALTAARALPADSPAAHDAVISALHAYLAAKLDLPPGGVERERVLQRLGVAGAGEALRDQVAQFFDRAERARYAAQHGDRDALARLAAGIVATLEQTRGLERLLGALLAVSLTLGGLAGVTAAADPPQAAFFRGNEAYAAGRYDEAVRAWEALRAAGTESGALHFNLGNAYVKQGDLGRAIASYERAARLLPRDPDVAANLAFAREEAHIEPPPPPLWQRVLAPAAFRATARELAAALVAVWLLLWAALIARALLPQRATVLGRIAGIAGLAALFTALNLAVRVTAVETCRGAVVVAPGSTPARFEPAPGGTEHFTAVAGEAVEIAEQRDGWHLIARADGRRGWVPAASVERLTPACDE